MDWVSGAELLGLKLESPLYTATILCEPIASDVVAKDACPALSVTGLPSAVAPSMKVTVPLAVLGETVAFKVTCEPASAGFSEEFKVVVASAPSHMPILPAL